MNANGTARSGQVSVVLFADPFSGCLLVCFLCFDCSCHEEEEGGRSQREIWFRQSVLDGSADKNNLCLALLPKVCLFVEVVTIYRY